MDTSALMAMTAPPAASAKSTSDKNGVMGKEDFLKILMAQLSHMDPMSPDNQDPTQSIAQMAQFSMIEQLTNLTKANENSSAMAMLGKTATYKNAATGETREGLVKSVDTSGGEPKLTIGDASGIAIGSVTGVR
jgi:flagellar basal-body rod modification protein FlgD